MSTPLLFIMVDRRRRPNIALPSAQRMPHTRFHANQPKTVHLYREQIDGWMDRVICEIYTRATLELNVDGVRAQDSHGA